MTHLRIEQNNGVIEEVSTSVITKLYEIAHAGLDVSSNLLGRLHVTKAYGDEIDWLKSTYSGLYINADDRYIRFIDAEVQRILASNWGDGTGLSENDVANKTKINTAYFNSNTQILNFPELGSFESVKRIENNAFSGCTNLQSIDLSNIEEIGYLAFMNCENLSGIINLPSIVKMGYDNNLRNIFYNCKKITEVNFGPNLLSLTGASTFSGDTALTTVTGLSNITKLGDSAFKSCTNLTTIDLDFSKLIWVGTEVFLGCSSLQSIQGPVVVIGEKMFRNCTSLLSVDLSGILSDANSGGSWFRDCTALTTVTTDWSNSIGHIGGYAFSGCTSLSTIDLTNITAIGESAFSGCSALTSVTGTSGITSIGKNAFNGCTNLVSTFDFANTTTVQESAFKNCKYCTFTNLDKVSNFGTTAFSGTNIPTSVQFKDGVSIGMQSFENSNVLSIEFLGGGTIGHKGILKAKSLQSIIFNADIALGASCFQECTNLQSVDLSNISELSLFYNAGYGMGGQFSGCLALSSATLNPNITRLPSGMFSYCGSSNLELTIPAGVTEIGENFLYGTNGVKLTVLATTPPTLANLNALGGMTYIKVPAGTLSAYQSAQYWSSKASVMSELPS